MTLINNCYTICRDQALVSIILALSVRGSIRVVFGRHQGIGVCVKHGEAGQTAIAASISILSTCAVAKLLLRKFSKIACAVVQRSLESDSC